MKLKLVILIVLALTLSEAYGQSTRAIINGGWALLKVDGSDESEDGFKFGAAGESIMSNNKIAIGGSINYMGFKFNSKASDSTALNTETKYHAVPINLSGKLILGNKLQGYAKGIAGFQISTLKVTAQNAGEVKTKNVGWSYGYGAGIILHLNETTSLHADWESDYLTNSEFQDVVINAFSIGLGVAIN